MHQDIGVHLYWMLNDNEEWVKICCTFTGSPGSTNIIVVATLLPGWQEESYGSASWDCFLLSALFPPPSHDRKKFRLGHRCRRKYAADATHADQRQPFDSLHAFTLPVSKTLHWIFTIGADNYYKGCCIQVINWLSHFSPCGESWQAWCSLNCWWENVGGVLETSHATLRN